MVFTALTEEEVLPGEPCKSELFDKIRGNLDDIQSRLTVQEGTTGGFAPLEFYFAGTWDSGDAEDEVGTWRVFRNITLLAARLFVSDAGSAGTLEVEVERWNGSAWSSITTGPLSAAHTDGDKYVTSGTISIPDIDQGQLLRVNLNSVQTDMKDFAVYVEYEAR